MWRRSPKSSPDWTTAAVLAAAALLAAAAPHDGARAAHANLVVQARDVLAGGPYQTRIDEDGDRAPKIRLRPDDMARLLLYGVLLYALAMLGLWIYRRFRESEAPGPPGEASGAVREGRGPGLGMEEADRLAREERYGEAVHALLLLSIRRLALGRRFDPEPWRTSRELARTLPRTQAEREAFTSLVRGAELFLFGKRSITAEDWEASRRCYAALRPEADT